MKRPATAFAILVYLTLLQGCATSVIARRVVPAKYDTTAIKTVAVSRFDAYNEAERATGLDVANTLKKTIADAGRFRLVGKAYAPSRARRRRNPSWQDSWRRFGKEVGADAVLGGEIDLAWVREKAGEADMPVVKREAALVITTHLIETNSGKFLGGYRLVEHAEERIQGTEGIDSLPSDEEMMHRLVVRVAERISLELGPHLLENKLVLARCKACAEGNNLARKGQWAEAFSSWNSALKTDQGNHAVIYNVGVAHEYRGAYDKARNQYRHAIEIKRRSLYKKALKRVERILSPKK